MSPLDIDPPLLNSANPWCTTLSQLQDLYTNPHTGAITTRTSLPSSTNKGFPHDPSIHQFTFFTPDTLSSSTPNTDLSDDASTTGSLNTLGYSPIPLSEYISYVQIISNTHCTSVPLHSRTTHKPIIISVTGTADQVVQCYRQIRTCQRTVRMQLAMEINLSCPNIPEKPPPAYSRGELAEYLRGLGREMSLQQQSKENGQGDGEGGNEAEVAIGIKTPPYTYHDQFQSLIDALLDCSEKGSCPVGFITAVNTLGSSLLVAPSCFSATTSSTATTISPSTTTSFHPTLASANGTGIGGLAGTPLHPLALGNVYTITQMLAQHEVLRGVQVIGVGGVADKEGYRRMRGVGARAVGVGTALGRKGVGVFEEIGAAKVEQGEGKT
ncbi:hypothetical protein COCSADRAFT_162941 [Bipolaris sorokiniana ND90Pr]|uniref:Dihydroorotate dehydrogenase catalytic domain-containing protein n=1 Tax=Cochliobolus sativus (strain ND90Pr / ATCC 201652) TaxID=665912 RepID=M2R2P0_COCSN|nr:uncharacterized protein COCSADRAFT_162941 [Bipolaris sorokiniana ND90Pr]EMD61494.1 hypothetical protein COCSADRAFT_162941 [Bipolaris sorokiniana ND90Pr]